MTTMTIRPGLLVSLKTSLSGGVSYRRIDLDASAEDSGVQELKTGEDFDAALQASVARWETTRRIEDPDEHKRATVARGKASALIRAVCIRSAFGLLCPTIGEPELDAALVEAQKIVSEFNESARFSQIKIYVLKGRIADNDVEAAKAIASEVRDLLAQMRDGIAGADVEAIREAANRANKLGGMLGAEQAEQVDAAVSAARKAARALVKRVQKEGEQVEAVLAEISTSAIDKARFAFLDTDDAPSASNEPELPAVNLQRVAGLDLC